MHVRNRNRAKQSTALFFPWSREDKQTCTAAVDGRRSAAAPEIHDELLQQRLEHGGLDLGADVVALGLHVGGD